MRPRGARPAALRPPAGLWPRSFVYAAAGLARVWRSERNFRVQAAAAWAVLALAWLVRLPSGRTAVLLGVMAAVLAAETLNTALEATVDLVASGPHPLAAAAKDLAAGAVLCISLGAAATGVAAFWPWLVDPRRLGAALAGQPLGVALALAGLGLLVVAAAAPLAGRRSA